MGSASPNSSVLTPPLARPGEPAWEVAYLFPAQGNWTEEDYLGLESNRLVEFSDGFVEVLPMPTLSHQLIVAYLYRVLADFIGERELGKVLFAPLPVRLWPGKIREPDLIYLRPDRLRDTRRYPHGADLVMEVVSDDEDSRRRDLLTKSGEYAKAGITEYWIVDPLAKNVSVLVLQVTDPAGPASYRLHGEFGRGDAATSVLLAGLSVPVSDVFAAGETR